MQCNYQNCHANALHDGDGRCFFHSEIPAIIIKRNAARSRGGRGQRKPDHLQHAIELAHDALEKLAAGTMKVETAKIISRLVETIVYADESRNLKERLHRATTPH